MITYHDTIEQGSDSWHALRCGKLTASEMKLIITPTLKVADNDKCRTHLWELLAQRITGYVEPQYISDDMLNGKLNEPKAKLLYSSHYAPITDMGFVTNDEWGFTIGYSPDGLVGNDGLVEVKSRKQKYQIQRIAECSVDPEHMIQIQAGLLVTKREWLDYISYCGGTKMITLRVYPDVKIQNAIVEAATLFENKLAQCLEKYNSVISSDVRLIDTEREIEEEIAI